MCPYVDGWREHLAAAYARVARELRPDGMYLDEFGRCMPSRICHATDHGHPAPAGMAPGEWILTRRIRSAVPPQIPLYCEFAPADVARQWLDGAFGHVALAGHKPPCNTLAPHHVDLARFAFPDFNIFELIYYVPLENGNWHLLKYPFFNGSGYYLTGPSYKDPAPAPRAFLRRALALLRRYADAFASSEVEHLVPTECPGLYANRFETPTLTVWTLFNSNPRTARGRLLTVPHRDGARYIDAWNDRPLHPTLADGRALLEFEIGPRAIGCVARTTGAEPKPGS